MSKTFKEQIRESAFKMSGSMGTDAIDYVWSEIEDFAKQEAIAFAEWKDKSGYEFSDKDNMFYRNTFDYDVKSGDELYQLYLNQSKQ